MSFTFIFAALMLAVTPGPGIAYVVARTVASGSRVGLACCFGTALGGMLHVIASALGLSLLIAQSALAFDVLKYAGAAYLIYLGLRMLMRQEQIDFEQPLQRHSTSRALLEGVMVEVLNVKTALFFLAFLPQFLDANQPALAQLFLMGTVCVLFNTAADVVAVRLANKFLQISKLPSVRTKQMTKASGLTMLILGVWVAFTRRSV